MTAQLLIFHMNRPGYDHRLCFCQVQGDSSLQHLDKALVIFSWTMWAVLELNFSYSTVPTME